MKKSVSITAILIKLKDIKMKKIIIAVAMLAFGTVSSHAIDRSAFSLTAGLAANQGVFGASAKETNLQEDNTAGHIKKESGVFTDGYHSTFIEMNIGEVFSVGYEHTPDSITTPTNTSREGGDDENNMRVDFNELNTIYVKLNLPFATGMYVRAGTVSTDIDITETGGSNTYKNVSTDGEIYGVGYSKTLGDSPVGLRIEGSYLEFDNVSANNGVAADGGSPSNGGRNTIDASNLEGLNAKLALTITLGGN